MRVVSLVPWRPGDPLRERHWAFVRPHLESLGYDLFTGDSVGPWARAAACNSAAEQAGAWDVALITDADTLLEPDAVARAVHMVRRGGAVRPHDHRYMLGPVATKRLLTHGLEDMPARFLRWTVPGGGALVISRTAWDKVGGYDTHYVEWGHEDTAMNISLVDRWTMIPGNSYHLFHPPPNMRTPTARANRGLMEAHREAHRDAIERASRRAGFDLNTVL